MKLRHELLAAACRVVVKVGTGLLTDDAHRLSSQRVGALVAQLAALREPKR